MTNDGYYDYFSTGHIHIHKTTVKDIIDSLINQGVNCDIRIVLYDYTIIWDGNINNKIPEKLLNETTYTHDYDGYCCQIKLERM